MSDSLDYGSLMHRAMRGLIYNVLEQVRDHGLPGNHHFFITFDTTHPDVQIASWLIDRYPTEMTIVIQHWFDNLVITEDGFSITLNLFNDLLSPFSYCNYLIPKKVEGVIVTIMLKTNNFVLEGQIQQIKDNYLNFS